jgi:glycosyltransferase involved in cell wall biosynthesis
VPFWSEKGWEVLYQKGRLLRKTAFLLHGIFKRLILIFSIPAYNMIFIHREVLPLGPPLLEFIISRILKKKVIYDFDDAIWLANTSQQNTIAAKLKWHSKVRSICKWSWRVSCGNDFLAQFAQRYNPLVSVNPTTIDTQYHVPGLHKNELITIGWTGTHSTSKYLKSLTGALEKLRLNYNFRLLIISNQKPDLEFGHYQFEKWSLGSEIDLLNSIDIGIMPLEDTVWEKGKCGFKALQYMALEIPTVASAVGANRQIIDHEKNGYLCTNESDWLHYLSKLMASDTLRKQIGKEGRKKVLENYSLSSNFRLFLSFFE